MTATLAGIFDKLSCLHDRQLELLFQLNRGDVLFLKALNEELKKRDSDEALHLQIQVVKSLRSSARAASPSDMAPELCQSGSVDGWLQQFLNARGLPRPDGRPFHRYRMTDGEYVFAKKILRHLARQGRLAQPDYYAGAVFVAYCAEWFRRESSSTFLRWEDPAPDLIPSVPYASIRRLTDLGLDYWHRSLRRSRDAREFLLTVALEG